MKRLTSFLLLLTLFADAQTHASRYFISFTDKKNTGYSIEQPFVFLSERAIERRNRHGISIVESDLPVSGLYVNAMISVGATVICKSKWMNGVVVETSDTVVVNQLALLPFVKEVTAIYDESKLKSKSKKIKVIQNTSLVNKNFSLLRTATIDYGFSTNQAEMIQADYLHNRGLFGEGIIIAMLDAGFYRVDSLHAFDSLRVNNQIIGTWDFVNNEQDVYADNSHGMSVLSCIAANLPGTLVGTAPHASFYLLRSEDASSETIAEEYYWAAAAEYADSVGADIISSSLGYTTFDDPSQNYSYADMNGHTAVSTIAANHAASVGILVVNSAGNLGASSWNFISAPADADSALSIGAVNAAGGYAFFSSNGPSFDNDVKPNVAAQGQGTYVVYSSGFIGPGSGTSFSAPVLSGAAACLWQSNRSATNMEIFQAIQKSASQYFSPDTLLGYGIPNFKAADILLKSDNLVVEGIYNVYPNPFNDWITVDYYAYTSGSLQVKIYDMLGRELFLEELNVRYGLQSLRLLPAYLGKGVYVLEISNNDSSFNKTLIKN